MYLLHYHKPNIQHSVQQIIHANTTLKNDYIGDLSNEEVAKRGSKGDSGVLSRDDFNSVDGSGLISGDDS